MKIKVIFLSVLFLIPFFKGISQNKPIEKAIVTVGKPYPVHDAGFKQYVYIGDKMVAVKYDKDGTNIQVFDAETLKMLSDNDVSKQMPSGSGIENIFVINGKLYLFYNLWDRDNKKEQLFYKEIDYNTGSFIGNEQLMMSVNGKLKGNYAIGWVTVGKFQFQFSQDTSKILIKFIVREDDNKPDVIVANVFNKNLEPVWDKKFKLPYSSKKMEYFDFVFDNQGSIYILAKLHKEAMKYSKKQKDTDYQLVVLKSKEGSDDLESVNIDLEGHLTDKLWMLENPNKGVICAGFYHKSEEKSSADGIFTFKIGNDNTVKDLKYFEIPLEILNQYVSKRTQEKNAKKEEDDKAEFTYMVFKNLRIEKDGSIILIGEQQYSITYTNTNGKSYTTNYFNDILMSKINPDGELIWMKKLPKRQSGGTTEGLSFSYLYDEQNHYLLYLDNVKNLNLPLNKEPEKHIAGQGGFLTAYQVDDNTGTVSKKSIFDTRNVKGMEVYQFGIERIVPTRQATFLVEVYKKNKEDMLIKTELHKDK